MQISRIVGAMSFALVVMTGGAALAEGDPAKGEKVYRKCKACHSLEAGKNKVGPSLAGIIDRPAGKVDGFKYSKAMMESGVTWTVENIEIYITKPKEFIKGNRMAFAGIKKPDQRADLIAYLMDATK